MRFDTPVYFQRTTAGPYDADTGDYGADTIEETKVYASVTDSGIETLKLIYGGLKQGVKTIRLLAHYNEPFDHIRIDNKVYKVDFERKLRTKHAFVAHEVQRGKD